MAQAPSTSPTPKQPTTFGILLFPGFEPLDVFGPAEALLMPSRTHKIAVHTISTGPDLSPVTTEPPSPESNPLGSAAFQSVVPTHTVAAPPLGLDVLIVPGGLGTRVPPGDPRMDAAVAWIAETYPSLDAVLSVCTGARLLTRAGVLEGRRATTNKVAFDATAALSSGVEWVREARWVKDGNVWTSGGVSAGTDMMLAFIAERWGMGVAREATNRMEYDWRNDPSWDPFAYAIPANRK